jgi:hypothetical protein
MRQNLFSVRSWKQRSWSFPVIGIACLSLWHVTLAALLCPHFSGLGDSCKSQLAGQLSGHVTPANSSPVVHDMSAMHADLAHATNSAFASNKFRAHTKSLRLVGEPSVSSPTDDCAHCSMQNHLEAPLTSRGLSDLTIRYVINVHSTVSAMQLSQVRILPFKLYDHGPPGEGDQRHVFINVFRI